MVKWPKCDQLELVSDVKLRDVNVVPRCIADPCFMAPSYHVFVSENSSLSLFSRGFVVFHSGRRKNKYTQALGRDRGDRPVELPVPQRVQPHRLGDIRRQRRRVQGLGVHVLVQQVRC